MTDKTVGLLAVSAGSIFLGSVGIFVRFAGVSLEPMTQSFGRIFAAFLFISLYNLLRYKGSLEVFKISGKDLWLFATNGLIGFSILAAAFTSSILFTSISNTYFLLYTAPIWVVIIGAIFLKEKIKQYIIISILLSFIGLFFLFNPTNLNANLFGNFFGLVTGITFGAYFVITEYLGKTYRSPTITFWTQLFGALGLFPLIFLFDKNVQFLHTLQEWLPVIGAGFVVFIGYVLLNYGLTKIKASTGSILSLFEPLSSVVYGLVLFSEIPGVNALIGSSLILISIVYLTLKSNHRS